MNSLSIDSSFKILYLGKEERITHGIDFLIKMCNISAWFIIYGKVLLGKGERKSSRVNN